ncbi:hypothetical protein PC123_g18218 [Phytophthora cactorum]|nr:hypothetical protein PC123_g18218 [Phytophthora cactorum]
MFRCTGHGWNEWKAPVKEDTLDEGSVRRQGRRHCCCVVLLLFCSSEAVYSRGGLCKVAKRRPWKIIIVL